jgi:hypothetical protein
LRRSCAILIGRDDLVEETYHLVVVAERRIKRLPKQTDGSVRIHKADNGLSRLIIHIIGKPLIEIVWPPGGGEDEAGEFKQRKGAVKQGRKCAGPKTERSWP